MTSTSKYLSAGKNNVITRSFSGINDVSGGKAIVKGIEYRVYVLAVANSNGLRSEISNSVKLLIN